MERNIDQVIQIVHLHKNSGIAMWDVFAIMVVWNFFFKAWSL